MFLKPTLLQDILCYRLQAHLIYLPITSYIIFLLSLCIFFSKTWIITITMFPSQLFYPHHFSVIFEDLILIHTYSTSLPLLILLNHSLQFLIVYLMVTEIRGQILPHIKSQINSNTTVVGDFKTSFSSNSCHPNQKKKKRNQKIPELTDIYQMEFRLLQNVIPKHCRTDIFPRSPWKIDHILRNKASINK